MKKRVTRDDVAKLAGVSPAVVSYVMNNSNYVSEEKRIAVLNAVKELKYTPIYLQKICGRIGQTRLLWWAIRFRQNYMESFPRSCLKRGILQAFSTAVKKTHLLTD